MKINENYKIQINDVVTVNPSSNLIEEITRQLQENGIYCLEKSLDLKTLEIFQKEVENLISTKGRRYFSIINPYKNIESNFNVLEKSSNLHKFLIDLAEAGVNTDLSTSEILNVLRIVTGKNADGQSLNFHYDATVLTALIPILIPVGSIEDCGHLLAHKNLRKVRGNVIINVIEKIILQNLISQKIISFLTLRKPENYVCELKEGNIYFFYGYRTLHANYPVNPNFIRATLLFHFGDPHGNSFLIKSIAKFRHWREKINFK